ncbi:MAG: YhdP family protein, partial [Stenotrophobium sp.]
RAVLKNFGYAAADGPVGVSGISGELSADEDSGRLHLAGGGVTLDLPQAMRNPVPFDALTGELQWHRQSEGWQLSMPQFTWQLAGTQGQGAVSLLLPSADGQSPNLDLTANFDAADANRLKPFIPTHWHPHLHDWLTDGILGGRVANGVLRIHGPLADFPFEKNPDGKWQLDFDANAVKLLYHPDWPEVDDINAHLTFTGNRLDISADSGSVKGLHLIKASARFADFNDAQLQVDATVGGELPRFYDFLRASPLKKTLAGLVDHTSASGAAKVEVHLDIPLKDAAQTEVNGDVALDDAQLRYKGLSQPIHDISGNIEFNQHGVLSTPISAKFEDLDLDVRIAPREGTKGVISAGFDYGPQADGGGVSEFVPELLRKALSGHAHWTAELPLAADNTGLTLRTDMKGIAVALPAPLGKTAEQAVPLSIVIDAGNDDKTRVRVDYQDRLSADIALAPAAATGNATTGATVTGVNLQLGKGPAPVATSGVYVSGATDDLDLGAWHAALGTLGNSSLALQKIDLHAGHLHLLGQTVSDVHLLSTPVAQGSSTLLDGAGAEGKVDWDKSAGGRLTARLKHLRLDAQPPPTDEAAASASATEAPAQDPAQLPQLDIRVDQLDAGSADLGKATVLTQRIAGGQSLAQCELTGGKTTLSAGGQWTRLNGQSSAALKFDLSSHDIAAVLKAFGYAPNLDAKDSHFTGDLKWPARAAGLKWELAQGPIAIDVKTGKLSAVESGAGRVLGLLNFYALPRRLTLDFRDVTGSGLAFDSIGGSFDLADGVAKTGNLDIDGPSLRMEVRGQVGLLARDLDQTVKVYPSVSSGVTLGAALLGGPAVGALVLIAQQVLKQPLEKLTELDYHVTGSWDNPKIQ